MGKAYLPSPSAFTITNFPACFIADTIGRYLLLSQVYATITSSGTVR
ncbi:MAG: hypothetical protein MRT15_07415 [archaeon YNP-LCB-003-016]|nr:hypothetical protein [Candidatus Culexarchaeum yellowstonense]